MLKNGLYNGVATAIRMTLGVLVVPVLIRLIGLDAYGLWTLVSSVIDIVELAEVGLSVSTTFFISQDLANHDSESMAQTLTVTVGAVLAMATLAAMLLWFSAGAIVGLLAALSDSQQSTATAALRAGVLIVWAQLLQRVCVGIEQAYQKYQILGILIIVQAVVSNLGLLAVAVLGRQVVALVQWQSIINCGILLLHIGFVGWLLHGINFRLRWSAARARAIVRYSVLTWLISLSGALFSRADRLVVGALLGVESVGIYGAITTITGKINTLSAVPVQPLLPVLSAMRSNREVNSDRLKQHIQQSLQLNAVIALGMAAVLFVFAPVVMRIMIAEIVTEEYVLVFRLATLIFGLYSVNAVGYYILFAVNQVGRLMIVQMLSALLSLFLVAVASRYLGLMGAILGNAGYLGVGFLTFFGMRFLNIPAKLWINWCFFPLVWFTAVVFLSVILSGRFVFEIALIILAGMVLLGWFFSIHYDGIFSRRLIQK